MATEFLMPKLGLTMEEGTIVEWLVADGSPVAAGSAVLRIETDKTETEVESADSGRLHRIGEPGDTFACGEQIGWLLADGEAVPAGTRDSPPPRDTATVTPTDTVALVTPPGGVAAGGRILASPIARRLATERDIDLRTIRGTGPGGRIVSEDLDGAVAVTTPAAAGVTMAQGATPTVPATAAARQLADLLGIDLQSTPADPVDGRVTKESVALHVRSLLAERARSSIPDGSPQPARLPAPLQTPTSTVRLSGMRGTIAKRMHESLRQMAQLTLHLDADLDAVVADRERRKEIGAAPSFTDYVIAAAARALVQHPIVNSQITDEGVALLPTVHVGMAVALDNGLVVPVISETTHRDLASLSTESTRLAEAARAGTLSLQELGGGTFSVTTLGSYGVNGFTPVINPPNTAILGVGRLRDDVVLGADGKVGTAKRLTLSLTWDHRAFDGAPAAAFCSTIAELLTDPAALDQVIA